MLHWDARMLTVLYAEAALDHMMQMYSDLEYRPWHGKVERLQDGCILVRNLAMMLRPNKSLESLVITRPKNLILQKDDWYKILEDTHREMEASCEKRRKFWSDVKKNFNYKPFRRPKKFTYFLLADDGTTTAWKGPWRAWAGSCHKKTSVLRDHHFFPKWNLRTAYLYIFFY